MVKLGYLSNASTIPHAIFDNMMKNKNEDSEGAAWAAVIGPYKGPPTQKHIKTWNLIREAQAKGDKTLVFSGRRANLTLGQRWAERQSDPPTFSLIVDGTVNNTKKHQLVQDFRKWITMWCGQGCAVCQKDLIFPRQTMLSLWTTIGSLVYIDRLLVSMLRPQQTKDVT